MTIDSRLVELIEKICKALDTDSTKFIEDTLAQKIAIYLDDDFKFKAKQAFLTRDGEKTKCLYVNDRVLFGKPYCIVIEGGQTLQVPKDLVSFE